MKTGIRDKAEGAFHVAKGRFRQAAGKLTDNPKLEIAGKIQEKIGQVKKVFGK